MPLFDGFFACDAPTFLPVIPLESGIQPPRCCPFPCIVISVKLLWLSVALT